MERKRERPYYSLNEYYRELFGEKVYKVSIDAGFTCPNRDGTLGNRGCIFCSAGGSGDFAGDRRQSITEQIQYGITRMERGDKNTGHKYIAYFQAFTNTYAPISELREKYQEALAYPDIVGLSIATRPDCINEDVLSLLLECKKEKKVWVELGLQTIHEETAEWIRRGYTLPTFAACVRRLQQNDIDVIAHVILGLPGESMEQMLQTVSYVRDMGIKGIKLQLLHVLRGTDLYSSYVNHEFETLSMEAYVEIIVRCIDLLSEDVVIHRLTGDGSRKDLVAPLWSLDKRKVLNTIHRVLKERKIAEGTRKYAGFTNTL